MATPRNNRPRSVNRSGTRPAARNIVRRQSVTNAPPPDYRLDYAYVRRDLLLILIIGGVLFALMVAAAFVL